MSRSRWHVIVECSRRGVLYTGNTLRTCRTRSPVWDPRWRLTGRAESRSPWQQSAVVVRAWVVAVALGCSLLAARRRRPGSGRHIGALPTAAGDQGPVQRVAGGRPDRRGSSAGRPPSGAASTAPARDLRSAPERDSSPGPAQAAGTLRRRPRSQLRRRAGTGGVTNDRGSRARLVRRGSRGGAGAVVAHHHLATRTA